MIPPELKKPGRVEAMRRAAAAGRRFLAAHPQGDADTLIIDMAHAAERAALTIPNWWAAYAVSAGIYHSIIKSTPAECLAFCDWLDAQVTRPQQRAVEPKPQRVPRGRKTAERQLRKQQAKFAAGLDTLVTQHGRETVLAWLAAWINGVEAV